MDYKYVYSVLPRNIKVIINDNNIDIMQLMEIRLRENRPLIIVYDNKEIVFEYIVRDKDKKELNSEYTRAMVYNMMALIGVNPCLIA